VAALARHSAGIPRVVNHLADGALALAALRRATIVDAATVSIVADGCALARSPSVAAEPGAVLDSGGDEIPVLTESVDAVQVDTAQDAAALDPLDPAATMTLLDDDLDDISAEIAAQMLAVDAILDDVDAAGAGLAGDAGAPLPHDEAARGHEPGHADIESSGARLARRAAAVSVGNAA